MAKVTIGLELDLDLASDKIKYERFQSFMHEDIRPLSTDLIKSIMSNIINHEKIYAIKKIRTAYSNHPGFGLREAKRAFEDLEEVLDSYYVARLDGRINGK